MPTWLSTMTRPELTYSLTPSHGNGPTSQLLLVEPNSPENCGDSYLGQRRHSHDQTGSRDSTNLTPHGRESEHRSVSSFDSSTVPELVRDPRNAPSGTLSSHRHNAGYLAGE